MDMPPLLGRRVAARAVFASRKIVYRAGAALMCGALVLTGCEVGPNYVRPATTMPSRWESPPTTQASVTVAQPLEVEQWWTTFKDPELDSLVRRAVESNLDLQAATERICQARASLGIATAGFFPTAGAQGSYRRNFSAGSGSTVVITGGGGTGTITGGGTTSKKVGPVAHDLWQGGLDAAWELDIFGGVRRSIEAADANLQATVEDRRDVLVTMLGEVATDYVTLRGLQQEVVIAQENLEAQVRNAGVVREKKRLGTGTNLDIAQADAVVASTRADIATLQSNEQQEIYALSVLLGLQPTALDAELAVREQIPTAPSVVPVGMPSDLLRRRPDIRRAERQLAAATAEIGVATADLFPRFSLSGTLTVQGSRYEALSNLGTRFWSFGPNVTWPIFDAGQIWSNIHVQNSLQAQALIAYKSTILVALQDVQNALVAFAREQERRSALADAVVANQQAVELATQRYKQGLTDFLNVLDAERSLYGAQDALVQSNRQVAINLIALYKALGGGWETLEEQPTTRPSTRPSSMASGARPSSNRG